MDQELMRAIDLKVEEDFQRFCARHEVFVIAFPTRPIHFAGVRAVRQMDEKFAELVTDLCRNWKQRVSRGDYFKAPLPMGDGGDRPFYWYLILSIPPDIVVDRTELQCCVVWQLRALTGRHGIRPEIFSMISGRAVVENHIALHQMWSQWSLDLEEASKKDANGCSKNEPERSSRGKGESKNPSSKRGPLATLPPNLDPLVGEMSVAEFLKRSVTNAALVAHIPELIDFILHSHRPYKYWREEHLPLMAYIATMQVDPAARLQLGFESEKWDAKIVLPDASETIVEIIQALPKAEPEAKGAYHVRRAIVERMGRLSLEMRTVHQQGIDTFPDPVVEAINDKHAKAYPEQRVLLVAVAGEYTGEDDMVIECWLEAVRAQTTLGHFSAIYLVEIARSRVYRIF